VPDGDERIQAMLRRVAAAREVATPRCYGRVESVVGLSVTVVGVPGSVGDLVRITPAPDGGGRGAGTGVHGAGVHGAGAVLAEVVAIEGDRLSCLPLGPLSGVGRDALVSATGGPLRIQVGAHLRGRVLDGLGRPMDGGPPLSGPGAHAEGESVFVDNEAPPPLERGRVTEPLSLGVRAIDTLTPCGRGQRMGIFAGSGVGKSSLLSMITRGTEAEISVIALVGERGREVLEFLHNDLGAEGLARSVVVVATSDQPPLVRLRAAFVATRIAEWFRDAGADVLMLMDSITRTAMAQREVGLSVGEPPTTRGYPPSVFALLARLLERAGPGARGSITGLYTVLVNGDDHNEPIADAARSILDGHIVLDRRLATMGHFPSIDVIESISRVATTVTTPPQRASAMALRRLLAAYRDVRELIEIGAYSPGTNPTADAARALLPAIDAFLRQDMADQTPAPIAWAALDRLLERGALV
jgi:flagellum-specific ATP synthase